MFPLHFDQFGNQLQDTTRNGEDSDVLSPRSPRSRNVSRLKPDTLTTAIIQQPAYDSSLGSVPRFFEDITSPRKRENVADDSDGHDKKSKIIANVGKTKENQHQDHEIKGKQPPRGENSVNRSSALQKRLKNSESPASRNTNSVTAHRLGGNVPQNRFCSNIVSKRIPYLLLEKKKRKELAEKELGKLPRNKAVDNREVKTQELSTPSTKLGRVTVAEPVQENVPKNDTRPHTTGNDTPSNIKKERPAPMERKLVNKVKIEDRTVPDVTPNLEMRSIGNNFRQERRPLTAVQRTHGNGTQGRHNDALNANRKNETHSDNLLQSLRRQVGNENTTLKSDTTKSNAACKESVMNITVFSIGIQNKTSTSSLDPGLMLKNGKRIVLSEDALRPEIDRLLTQLTEYMAHQEEGDGVGRGGSPVPKEDQTLQTSKKVTEKDEKDLPETNYHQDLEVYRVQESYKRSKPPCACSDKGKDVGGSSTSLSESDGSDSSVMRSRRLPHNGHERSSHRGRTMQQDSFHSDSKEIGIVDYEQEQPRRGATTESGRRRERNDALKEKPHFKNQPTSFPVEAVSDMDDRIKRAERRRYLIRSSEQRSGSKETRTPDGYKSSHDNFELKSSRRQDNRRYSDDEDDGKYDNRSSKRRPCEPDVAERDASYGMASRRRETGPRNEKDYERSARSGRRRSTSAPQDGRGHGGGNRHRGSFSDEEIAPSLEEVVIRRYQFGRQSARGKVEEPRSQRSRQQRQEHAVERRESPDGYERSKEDTRYAVKDSGRRLGAEERGSNESVRHERRASNVHGRTSVDVRGSPEGRSDRERYRRESNSSSMEHKEIRRHVESRSSPLGRERSARTYEPDDLGSEDSADDARPRRVSYRNEDDESFRPRLDSYDCDTAERTRKKHGSDQREARHEERSRGAPRKDRRRSAHFEDDVDVPATQRWSIDSNSSERSRRRLESRRNSAHPDSLEMKERKGDASERRPTFDSGPRNGNAKSAKIAEATSRRASEQSKRVSPKISSAAKSTKPPGPRQDAMETIPPEKKVSKTRRLLGNAYRFGKHPIQAIKTRRRAARSAKSDGASKNGDNQKDKSRGSIAVDNYRAISVQTSPVFSSRHSRSADGSHHRTSLRRGETLLLPSSHVIVNRGVLDSAPARYGAHTRNPMEARRTMICGEDDGVIDIRDKKLKQCFCGQSNKKNPNAIDGFELLCACDANQCNCSPGNKPEARTSVPKQHCPTGSHGSRNGPSTQHRPCERRKGDDADAVILVRSGKYLEVDVSTDRKGRRTCGSRAEDASARHRENGRHGDRGGHRSGRHRDSLGSNSSDLVAYRQGSSSSMMGFDRDRGMVDKRYNIPPSKRGADSKHGGKDGDRYADDRYAKALGKHGRSGSGRGGAEDDDLRNSRGGRDGKSRSGRDGDIDGTGKGRDGKSRSGKGGENDPRNSKGGRGGKSGSGMDGEDEDKGGRGGKSRKGKGGDDDLRGGRGGKSGSGKDGENDTKNKKGMLSKSGSEKSGSDTEPDISKKGKHGKKADKSDKENQADLKAAEKAKADSGTGTDAAKGTKKKSRMRKETPEQRVKRLKREKERQEGGIYHGLVLHSSEDDPSAVMHRAYRS